MNRLAIERLLRSHEFVGEMIDSDVFFECRGNELSYGMLARV